MPYKNPQDHAEWMRRKRELDPDFRRREREKSRRHYWMHRRKRLAYAARYYQDHAEEICRKKREARSENTRASARTSTISVSRIPNYPRSRSPAWSRSAFAREIEAFLARGAVIQQLPDQKAWPAWAAGTHEQLQSLASILEERIEGFGTKLAHSA